MLMINPDYISEAVFKGVKFKFELFRTDSFTDIKDIHQVYGMIFNKEGDILLVSHSDKRWSLPGGHTEKDETAIDTLLREVYEESAVKLEVENCFPFFYQKAYIWENDVWKFLENQMRYIAFNPIHDTFVQDPDQDNPMVYQQYFPFNQLRQHLQWGDTIDFILKYAPEVLSKRPKNIY